MFRLKYIALTVLLLIIGFTFDALAFGKSETVQLQFPVYFGYGAVVNKDLNEIPEAYGEHLAQLLNEYVRNNFSAEQADFKSTKSDSTFCYGISLEPRLFIYYIGLGVNILVHRTQNAESRVESDSHWTDDASLSTQMTATGIVPTIYLRPFYSSSGYFIIGTGYGIYSGTIDIESTGSISLPADIPNFTKSYEGSSKGYHIMLEGGMLIQPVLLFNLGIMARYIKIEKFETSDGTVLKKPDDETKMGAGMTGIFVYAGTGIFF